MRIVPFGTSSGRPTAARNVSGLGLDVGASWILVDCGEGTQQQIMRSPLKISRIDAVLLTHLHGDHVLGLPGLLGTMGMEGRTAPLTLIGPSGMWSWLEVMLALPILGLDFAVEVIELDGTTVGHPANLGTIAGLSVTALPLRHRVLSFGFRFAEPERPGRVDAERAAELGLAGPELGRLQRGETVRGITPDQIIGPPRAGRVAAILGDTMYCETSVDLARNADILVHECTYAAESHELCEQWMHSCTADAARVAVEAGVRHLVVNHFSSRYLDAQRLVDEIRGIVPADMAVSEAVEGHPIDVERAISENCWASCIHRQPSRRRER
ncbi:MAG: ribonuclease Z [Actinobacteria bacterium]|nr:ribonuclease Z [Actinomycetota bacterium]